MNPIMSKPTPSTPGDSNDDSGTDSSEATTRSFVSSRDFAPAPAPEPDPEPAPEPIATAAAVPPPASTSMPAVAAERLAPRRRPMRALGVGVIVVLLGFAGGIGGWYVSDQYLTDDGSSDGAVFQPTNESPTSSPTTSTDSDAKTPRDIYSKLSPAVAHIDSRIVKTTTDFFGQQSEQKGEGTGSGFIIDDKGHIVTNAHVVQDAESVTVSLGVDNVEVPAKLVGADPSSDIAVLKFDPDADELDGVKLSIAEFGDSEAMQVGDPVLAIGNPFGLDRTLTTGVVSALQRNIPALNDFSISNVIQTDAAVNPGNSGGPLLNTQGEVIGVNSQISTQGGGFDGIAFAVPSSTVERVSGKLIKSGSIDYAWLGVEGGELTPELVKQLDLDIDEGVYLGGVADGGPADKAGLEGGRRLQDLATGETTVEGGDVLLKFDGEQLTSMSQLGGLVDRMSPGDEVKIEFLRDGKRKTATVTLGDRPAKSGDDSSSSRDG
jgi:S1-C subfamily serine protease